MTESIQADLTAETLRIAQAIPLSAGPSRKSAFCP
jgi:hypothetical protein